MFRYWFAILVLMVGSVAATSWLLYFDGIDMAIGWLLAGFGWVQSHQLLAAGVFFLISFISQLFVMPSGSLMLLVAGSAIGGLAAAGVFAIAQLLAAWPVYRLSSHAMAGIEARMLNGAKARNVKRVRERLATLKGNDLLATAVLRLTPVIPSAGACVLASASGIRFHAFLLGTALTCWIRPLFFASSGEALSEVALSNDVGMVFSELNLWPLLLVFFSVLSLFVLNSYVRLRMGKND